MEDNTKANIFYAVVAGILFAIAVGLAMAYGMM